MIHYDTLLQNAAAIFLQNATEVYYKMPQVFYYKIRQFYYKMRRLLQIATVQHFQDETKTDTIKVYLSKRPLLPETYLGIFSGRVKKITKI